MYSDEFKIGADSSATINSIETKIIFKVRIFLFINWDILFFILNKLITKSIWAIISNIIKPSRTNLLRKLFSFSSSSKDSKSKLIPRKIEWKIKKIADPIPKNKK